MKTYAMVVDGIVKSHFATDRDPAEFEDVAHLLVEAPDDIRDGMAYDGVEFREEPLSRAEIIMKIQDLEMRQARATRDALLNGDISRLQALEDEIKNLRVTLSETIR